MIRAKVCRIRKDNKRAHMRQGPKTKGQEASKGTNKQPREILRRKDNERRFLRLVYVSYRVVHSVAPCTLGLSFLPQLVKALLPVCPPRSFCPLCLSPLSSNGVLTVTVLYWATYCTDILALSFDRHLSYKSPPRAGSEQRSANANANERWTLATYD